MNRRARGGGATILALGLTLACACASGGGAPIVPPVPLEPGAEAELRRRVEGFYLRLAHRRFNTVETYNDRIMREHFRDMNLFLDYYADLAQALADSHFEKRRPLAVEVREIAFEGPELAQVEVRFVGADRRPLRPGKVELVRVDRWVRQDRIWWIEPGKL
jgi:hypothetical protein